MTSIFAGQPPKRKPFPIKTLVHLAVVARPLNSVHAKIAAYCSKQYIVYWIFQIWWISDFNYPVILRILGFFSSSFSRKLHHPQGSLSSVLMTGNIKKPNQLFLFRLTWLLPIHMSEIRSTSLYPSTASKVPVHHRMKSGVQVPPPKPGETKVQSPETMNIGEVTPPGKKDPEQKRC